MFTECPQVSLCGNRRTALSVRQWCVTNLKAYVICRPSPTPSAVLQLLHKETCCNQPPVICLPQKWNALLLTNKMFIITLSNPLFLCFYLHCSIRCLLLLVMSTWIPQLILTEVDLWRFLWKTNLLEVMRHSFEGNLARATEHVLFNGFKCNHRIQSH